MPKKCGIKLTSAFIVFAVCFMSCACASKAGSDCTPPADPRADINNDCVIDVLDMAVFARHWLQSGRLGQVDEEDQQQQVAITARARKICQIVGDWDKHLQETVANRTGQHYGLYGTDLGIPFVHKGRTYVLFGDDPHNADRDPIAYTQDDDLSDGLRLRFLQDQHGSYRPIDIPGISLAAFEVPTGGVSIDDRMYIFMTTDAFTKPESTMGRCVLAVSHDDGYNFQYLYDVSVTDFINVSPVKVSAHDWPDSPAHQGDVVMMFGSGDYRSSSVKLSAVPAERIEDKDAIRYFAGLNSSQKPIWSTRQEDAVYLFDQPSIGELSVTYNEFIGKWIMLYNCHVNRGINLRTADDPWGPWSKPRKIFSPWPDKGYCYFMHVPWDYQNCDSVHDPGRENDWAGEYGPYQFPAHATGVPQSSTTIYFTMSTWNPYTVVLMEASLSLVE